MIQNLTEFIIIVSQAPTITGNSFCFEFDRDQKFLDKVSISIDSLRQNSSFVSLKQLTRSNKLKWFLADVVLST